MLTKCIGCKKEFDCNIRKYKYNTKMGYKIYCSSECCYKDRLEKRVIVTCNSCGKEVAKRAYELRSKSGNYYCSTSCAATVNNTLVRLGVSHPNFKEGKASYRRKVLVSRINQCNDCGNPDIRVLEVHHIDENRSNNLDENLVLLCANCHKIRHYNNRINGI